MRRRWMPVIAALCLGATAAGLYVSGQDGRPRARYEPADGTVYLGVSTDLTRLDAFDQAAGIVDHPAVYNRWTTSDGPVEPVLADARTRPGTAPMISWNLPLADGAVAAGRMDSYLRAQAAAVKSFGGPVFIRPDWEMNATWNPLWNPPAVSPAAYIAAWRHLVALFRSAQVANAAFVWCPTLWPGPGGLAASAWYPGDDEVDWIGIDAYPQSSTSDYLLHGPGGMDDMASFAVTHGKPLMVAEWAPQLPQPDGAGPVELVVDWASRYPRTVKALVYFDFTVGSKDYLLDDHPLAAAELRRRVQFDPRYVDAVAAS